MIWICIFQYMNCERYILKGLGDRNSTGLERVELMMTYIMYGEWWLKQSPTLSLSLSCCCFNLTWPACHLKECGKLSMNLESYVLVSFSRVWFSMSSLHDPMMAGAQLGLALHLAGCAMLWRRLSVEFFNLSPFIQHTSPRSCVFCAWDIFCEYQRSRVSIRNYYGGCGYRWCRWYSLLHV